MHYNPIFCENFAKTVFIFSISTIIPRYQSTISQRKTRPALSQNETSAGRRKSAAPDLGATLAYFSIHFLFPDRRAGYFFILNLSITFQSLSKLTRRGLHTRSWGTAQQRAGSHRTATGNHREPHNNAGEPHRRSREPHKRSPFRRGLTRLLY